MSYSIDVYVRKDSAKIKHLSVKRDWYHPVTYNCVPMVVANSIGYGVYYDKDISFIWDGTNNPAKGIINKELVWEGRGHGSVSFATGLTFKSEKNVSLWTMPVPNSFMEEANVLSSVLSTSFFTGELSIVWKINPKFANKEIFIPAGKEIACIIPISISQFQDCNINVIEKPYPFKKVHDTQEYVDKLHEYYDEHGRTMKLYKKGMDQYGNILGTHEISSLNMTVKYENGVNNE